ncbi:hypothetical protein [Erythrobacter sp.]|uniref:hypothetical protein n=1 Tax=Erythrobacter sp. TaxID=1042 RepID=UPI002EA10F70|nr:hypothetical protein [Erythrobacter sp.]
MTTQFFELARRASHDGNVTVEEVLSLRAKGWGDGVISRLEAEALFALNDALDERGEEWTDFFVEAVVDFVLNGTQPRGQCGEEEARWLIAQVDRDGCVESMAELEAIVKIIERAENVPVRLKDFVIGRIEKEVLSGEGPTRCGGELSSVHITATEAEILRRIVFGSGSHGPAHVSRSEAEMLFRLKDATLAEDNAPEWDELFLDGVSNYLKGFALANAQLDHDRAKELDAFMNDHSVDVGRFLNRMAEELPNAVNHFGKVFGKKKTGQFEAQAAAGEKLTDSEQEWLNAMIDKDGRIDDLERRLIARIIEDGE